MDGMRRFLTEEAALEYQTGRVTRREFLRRAALITGGSLVGVSLLGNLACGAPAATETQVPASSSTPGTGETVSPADPRLEAGPVQFQSEDATLTGYLARPTAQQIRRRRRIARPGCLFFCLAPRACPELAN